MRTLLVALLLGVAGCRTIDDSLGSPLQDAMGTSRPVALTNIQEINRRPTRTTHPIWTKEAWTLSYLPSGQ